MLDHHLQKSIVTRLKTADKLTFSELKPAEIDNKLFTYHLKIVMREGFVIKNEDGSYSLSPAGEKLWKRMSEKPEEIALRAYSVLFMIIRHSELGWLLYRRKTHPVKDRVAFMHCTPVGTQSITVTATEQVRQKTGLECQFQVVGSGFFHTYAGERLDGFTNFTLLAAETNEGTLRVDDEHANYFWDKNPDFSRPEMLPNMKILTDLYLAGEFPFFIDESVDLGS